MPEGYALEPLRFNEAWNREIREIGMEAAKHLPKDWPEHEIDYYEFLHLRSFRTWNGHPSPIILSRNGYQMTLSRGFDKGLLTDIPEAINGCCN